MRRLVFAALLVGCPASEPGIPRGASTFFVHADVVFKNETGNSFLLRRVAMAIDGQPFATHTIADGDPAATEQRLGVATLAGGEHDVVVEADYQGNGYGVFAYLKGYRFKARLAYHLELPDARPRRIRCIGYEAGGPTTPLEERPQIRCELTPS